VSTRAARTQIGSDAGSATLELVVLAPALVLLLSLLVLGARTRMAETSIDQAAGQAARAASLARTESGASRDALAAARNVLDREGLTCSQTSVDVDTSGFSVAVGDAAEIAVQVSCTVPLSDLALPGLPGARTLTARAVSVLDTYRGRTGGSTGSAASADSGVGR
jgi:Flp pilus assembly protein TadG